MQLDSETFYFQCCETIINTNYTNISVNCGGECFGECYINPFDFKEAQTGIEEYEGSELVGGNKGFSRGTGEKAEAFEKAGRTHKRQYIDRKGNSGVWKESKQRGSRKAWAQGLRNSAEEGIIVDANILLACLIKNSATRKILLSVNSPEFYVPEFIEEEILKYSSYFAKKLNVTPSVIREIVTEIFSAAKIKVVKKQFYINQIPAALAITPDGKDAPYLALAMELKCPLWSNDKALKKQSSVKILNTSEVQWK
ncbi:MAG: PIN domain-containing protein [archaeon]|nr:PIN domain-containing protein [archaeon]